MSDVFREDERKWTTADVSKWSKMSSKPGLDVCPGISLEATWLLTRRQSAYRSQEHNTGICKEQENLRPWCKEKNPSESNDKDESIDAGHRGGVTRSSDEISVMEAERRGSSNLVWAGQPKGRNLLLG